MTQAARKTPASEAPPANEPQGARVRLAAEGLTALDAKDYATAEERFGRAEELFDAPTIVLGLARAQVGLGKFVEAQENYRKLIHQTLPANAPDAFRSAQKSATTEVQGLEAKIAWVSITIQGADKVEVTLDGAPLPAAALGVKRAVNPGAHLIKASGAGYRDTERRLQLGPGQSQELKLTMLPGSGSGRGPAPAGAQTGGAPTSGASSTGPAASGTSSTGAPASGTSSTGAPASGTLGNGGADADDPGAPVRVTGAVLLGVGGAGLVLGVVTGILAMNNHSELVDSCPNEVCPEIEQATIDNYNVTQNLSTVGFIAGGVLAVTGLVLVLAAPSASSDDASGAKATGALSLRIGPTGLGASLRF